METPAQQLGFTDEKFDFNRYILSR